MQWVKASERLPEKKRYYNCKFEGLPIIYWIDGNCIVLNGEIMDKSIYDKIEWLDESNNSEAERNKEDAIGFAKYKETYTKTAYGYKKSGNDNFYTIEQLYTEYELYKTQQP